MEPGNPSYEAAYATDGVLEYLTGLARHHGATGNDRALLAAAFELITVQEDALTDRLLAWLSARNDCHVIGEAVNLSSTRVPTISFKFNGMDSGAVARAMDDHGIAMRFGDFHSRRLVEHLGEDRDGGVLRVSMVHYNTLEQVDRLTDALAQIVTKDVA